MRDILERLGLSQKALNDATPICYLSPLPGEIIFAENDETPIVTLAAFKLNEKVHDSIGREFEISQEFAEELLGNFKQNSRGIQVLTDWEHGTDVSKGKAASGEVVDMRLNGDFMEWDVKLTPEAVTDLKNKRYRYFSPTWLPEWIHNSTKKVFKNVAIGGGFTNRPIQKTVPAINFSEAVLDPETTFVYKKDEDDELVMEARPDEREPGTYGDPDDDQSPFHQKNDKSGGVPPPPLHDTDTEVPNQSAEGGDKTAMDEEQLKELRIKLGLAEDAPAADVLAKAEELATEATAFSEHKKTVAKTVAFAEAYPEEFAWIQAAKTKEREDKSAEFAESFRIKHDGKTFIPTQQAQDKLKEVHLKFSNGEVAFAEVQDAIQEAISGDMVELGERGTANARQDGEGGAGAMTPEQAGIRFSELTAEEILESKKDGGTEISRHEAQQRVAKKHPEIVSEYFRTLETSDSVPRVVNN